VTDPADPRGEPSRGERRDRAHVDHVFALEPGFRDPVRPEGDGLDVRGVGHHRDHHIRVLRDVSAAGRADRAGRGDVVDRRLS